MEVGVHVPSAFEPGALRSCAQPASAAVAWSLPVALPWVWWLSEFEMLSVEWRVENSPRLIFMELGPLMGALSL